jgi:predicted RNA-binding Zn-ribbon protein involved in translation (DUF1610 family)
VNSSDNRRQRSPRPEIVSRAHGTPMLCPACGNDIYLDGPHVCPPGFVKAVSAEQIFYGYNALNKCCRDWMLLGWPQEDGAPRLTDDERGRMHFECPKCAKDLWFNIAEPDILIRWDTKVMGEPQPPALIGGRIRCAGRIDWL